MKTLSKFIRTALGDFVSLLYPNQCVCCNQVLLKQESIICFDCLVGLPRSNFHLREENPVEMLFWGRMKTERATSFFVFQKGSRYQKILHALKYQGLRDAGTVMGRLFAAELSDSGFFQGIDMIVPVPLHRKKERERGYNQSTAIAEGLAQICHLPVESQLLHRKQFTETQTRKGRWERWQNVGELFELRFPEIAVGKHILLVDDVVTTGATLEACGTALLKQKGVKISVATLAWASV